MEEERPFRWAGGRRFPKCSSERVSGDLDCSKAVFDSSMGTYGPGYSLGLSPAPAAPQVSAIFHRSGCGTAALRQKQAYPPSRLLTRLGYHTGPNSTCT